MMRPNHRTREATMTSVRYARPAALVATAFIALMLHAAPAAAIGTETPAPAPADDKKADAPKPGAKTDAKTDAKPAADDKAKADDKKALEKGDKKSELQFRDGYRQAYDLVYRQHDLVAGLKALHALGHDDHSDVATMIGYANRKLGHYDEAKFWYDKALDSNPRNARTLSYYGMWHAEQGNRLKAKDYLENVRLICGNADCEEYKALAGAIAGTASY
jgi:tetratricopeptide (TPR) repeat protein